MVSRAQRTALADWWWTVDRWLLASLATLIVAGLVLTMAASPPVAERIGLPTFHFVNRQALAMLPAVGVLVGTSFLTPRQVRRAAVILFVAAMGLIVVALLFGHEVKGSKRWILGVQPSEFLKPAFVILVAWAFSESGKRPRRAGQDDRRPPPAAHRRAADAAARLRPDHARLARLGGAVLHGRAALVLGVRPRRLRRGRA